MCCAQQMHYTAPTYRSKLSVFYDHYRVTTFRSQMRSRQGSQA